jgi:isopenicillin N synthase-like dioxygenase
MLTGQWSDDRLKSTYHRVRLPEGQESRGPRYSMAFFNQARSDVIIQGPEVPSNHWGRVHRRGNG